MIGYWFAGKNLNVALTTTFNVAFVKTLRYTLRYLFEDNSEFASRVSFQVLVAWLCRFHTVSLFPERKKYYKNRITMKQGWLLRRKLDASTPWESPNLKPRIATVDSCIELVGSRSARCKGVSLHSSQVTNQAGAFLGFCSMKRLAIFQPPSPGWDTSPSYPFIHGYYHVHLVDNWSSCSLLYFLLLHPADLRRGGLMVSALDSGSRGLGSSTVGTCVVFLDKTLNSHSASLHPQRGYSGYSLPGFEISAFPQASSSCNFSYVLCIEWPVHTGLHADRSSSAD